MRVLIVDDEKVLADSLALILRGEGHHVRVAYDGRSALETAKDFQPEFLITDFMMPEMDGATLAREVKQLIQNCTVIVITGAVERPCDLDAQVLSKPIAPSELLRIVKTSAS